MFYKQTLLTLSHIPWHSNTAGCTYVTTGMQNLDGSDFYTIAKFSDDTKIFGDVSDIKGR